MREVSLQGETLYTECRIFKCFLLFLTRLQVHCYLAVISVFGVFLSFIFANILGCENEISWSYPLRLRLVLSKIGERKIKIQICEQFLELPEQFKNMDWKRFGEASSIYVF